MRLYDVICPICNTMNKRLNLEETDGLMECEVCQTITYTHFDHLKECIPVCMKGDVMCQLSSR